MKTRIITGLLLAIIFLPVLFVKELFMVFQVLLIICSCAATNEIINMYQKQKKYPIIIRILLVVFSGILYLSVLAQWGPKEEQLPIKILQRVLNIKIGFLPTFISMLIILFSITVFYKKFDNQDVGKSLIAICYPSIGFSSLTIIRSLGLRYLVFLLIITISTDIFAYFTGVLFGKHKMCPSISPKKTWEGAIGGTFFAVVIASISAIFLSKYFTSSEHFLSGIINIPQNTKYPFKIFEACVIILISLIVSIFSQIGDLFASRLKRSYDIKDFSNIFPGHGGILDRLDSALFAGMVLFIMFNILNYYLPSTSTSQVYNTINYVKLVVGM